MKKLVIIFLWIQIVAVSLYAQSYMDMKKVALKYHKRGQAQKALYVVKKFIKKDPSDYRGKNLLAVLYYWNGDKNRAKELLKEIVSETDFPDASKLLIKILYKQGEYDDVIYYGESFLQNHENNAVRRRLASSYEKIGTAVPNTRVYKAKPKVTKIHESKVAKVHKQKIETTRVKFTKGVSEPVKKIEAKVSDDLAYILDVVEKDPKDAMSRSILAQYFYNQGSLENAYKYAKEALKIDSSYKSMQILIKKIEKNRNFKPYSFKIEKKAKKILEEFYKKQEYVRYVNLYKALEGQGASFGESEKSKMLMSSLTL